VPNKIRIVFLIDYFHRTGGTERHLALLAEWLQKSTFECTIVALDLGANPLLDRLRALGVRIAEVRLERPYTPGALARAPRLARLIKEARADIVQTFHQKSDTYGAIVARLAGVKHIISSKRDTGHLRRPWHFFLNRRLRGLFERVIVVADAVAQTAMANDGIDRSRIVRIYNGVDTARFAPPAADEALAARQAVGVGPEDFVVGMVAGFRPEKNHDVFFAALTQALPQIPTLKALCVGAGPLLDHYREAIGKGPLAGRVVFAGDSAEVSRYLRAMDVGCLVPGNNEGFSNAILEKMATGLPLVVTDVGGNAEAVAQGVNGLVIRPMDSPALTGSLVGLYRDPDKRRAMARKSRQIAEEKFSLRAMCEEHVRLYSSLVPAPRASAADLASLKG